ncbi:MAG TPA: hypothetical protein VM735_05635 [Candidatus Kapabacteria bacterium]|nr:hypothetical protein [Candidatus Kapabacteria bacterium]
MDSPYPDVDTKDLDAVRATAVAIYVDLFPGSTPTILNQAFEWAADAFKGRYGNFQPIDAKYHDLEHTLQGTLAFVRLLRSYKLGGGRPELTQRAFELGVIAILLHDTGYLKQRGDTEGTGAKYTLVHVGRSAEFARALLVGKGFSVEEIRSVENMIRCTGVNADLAKIPFQTELDRRVGYALGTADLLGQMAASDYIEKLETLYQEFEESNRYNNRTAGPGVFTSFADLRSKTPLFWQKYVLPKIETDFGGLYRFLADTSGRNSYLEKIEANIDRLQRELASAA